MARGEGGVAMAGAGTGAVAGRRGAMWEGTVRYGCGTVGRGGRPEGGFEGGGVGLFKAAVTSGLFDRQSLFRPVSLMGG